MQKIICKFSHYQAVRYCIHQKCKSYPFICKYCQNANCQNLHNHDGKYYLAQVKDLYKDLSHSQQLLSKHLEDNEKNMIKQIIDIKDQLEDILQIYQQDLIREIKKKNEFHDQKNLEKLTGAVMYRLDNTKRKNINPTIQIIQKRNQPLKKLFQVIKKQIQQYCQINRIPQKKIDKIKLNNLNEKIQKNRNYTHLYFQRALLYEKYQQYDQALQDYQIILQLDKEHSQCYNSRGSLYKQLQNYQLALNDFNQAILLDPKNYQYYNNRALVYKRLQRKNEALKDLDTSIYLNMNFQIAYYNRAILHYNSGDYPKALDDYTKAIQLDPDYIQAYNNRGLVYNKLSQFDKASRDFENVLQKDPDRQSSIRNKQMNILTQKQHQSKALMKK